MEWQIVVFGMFTALLVIMFTGVPISFSFMLVATVMMYFMQGKFGLMQLVLGMYDQLAQYSLTPIPFFMIMGEVFFQSGLVSRTLNSLGKFVKKIPGRLSIITLLGGGIFAALSGSAVANTAMFGSLMLPDMLKRGYNKELVCGSIMASGALAMVIPPSSIAVLLGSIANISVGQILIGAIIPGTLLIALYGSYIIFVSVKNPHYAPAEKDELEKATAQEKLKSALTDLVPLGAIFIVVMGVIYTGIGTPTEAAALGALGAYILTIFYGEFSWKLVRKTLFDSLKMSSMILIIIAGSAGFSQILALTGASRAAVTAILGFSVSPTFLLWSMLIIVIILGFFIEQTAIMMITLPMMMPIVITLGANQVWFAVLYLICLQIGQLTPPVGLALFTLKGVAPPEITMNHVYRGAIPFVILNLVALVILYFIPALTTWLPGA